MQELVNTYADLHQEPTGLPPIREISHQITIKQGTPPIKVRPYRYAHFQKNEIEKQVNEMLKLG